MRHGCRPCPCLGVLLLMLVWCGGPGRVLAQPGPGTQIITAADIRQAGLLRPVDLFRLLDGWTETRLDGWHTRVAAGPVTAEDGWEVWIDGHRVTPHLLGAQDLNRLPLALHDIAFVTADRVPQLHEGLFAAHGVLHVTTKDYVRVEHSGVLRAATWTGNEAGDPGPLRFLGDDTPNVDHLGPDYEGTIGWRRRGVWLRASGIQRKHFATDPAVLPRTGALAAEYPEIELAGGAFRLHLRTARTRHDALLQVAEADDFLFVEAFSAEVPANTAYTGAGLTGAVDLSTGTGLRYHVRYAADRLGERANTRGIDPDWRETLTEGRVEVHRHTGFEATAGLHAERLGIHTGYALAGTTLDRVALYGQLRRIIGRVQPTLALHLRTDGEALAPSGLLALRHAGEGHAFGLVLAYTEAFAAEAQPLWFWTQRGYPLLDTLGVAWQAEDVGGRRRTFLADIRMRTTPSPRWSVDVGLALHAYGGLALEAAHFTPTEPGFFAGPVRLATGQSGRILGLDAVLATRFTPRLHQRLAVHITPFASGAAELRRRQRTQPPFEVRSAWFFMPVASFSLFGGVGYRASSYWPAYAGAEDATGGRYRARVPGAWMLDLTLSKSVWHRRLRIDLVGRNLLDRTHRHHPLGASEALSLSIRVVLDIGTS